MTTFRHRVEQPRILLTRGPERAGELVRLLVEAGTTPVLSPLREARALTREERRTALDVLDALDSPDDLSTPEALPHGPLTDIVLTSVNGVRGLLALRRPPTGTVRIRCVGSATEAEARKYGMNPDASPPTQSARGLLEHWDPRSENTGTVLVAHGDPHRPELIEGLRERGIAVVPVCVYVMADYPAAEPLVPRGQASTPRGQDLLQRPPASRNEASTADLLDAEIEILDPEQTARCLRGTLDGSGRSGEKNTAERGKSERGTRPDVVIATSPELLRTLARWGAVPEPVICIGASTAAVARDLGLVYRVARSPRAQDLAEAALAAVNHGRHPHHTEDHER